MFGKIKSLLPTGKKRADDDISQEHDPRQHHSPLVHGGLSKQRHPFEGAPNFSPPPQPAQFQEQYAIADQGGHYNGGHQGAHFGEIREGFQGGEVGGLPPSFHNMGGIAAELPQEFLNHNNGMNAGFGHSQMPVGGGLHAGGKVIQPQTGWLTAEKICKTYGKRQVVKEASICVRRGESVGLLGPNGAGKTTMFYMITGLVTADEGHIHIDGYDVTRLPMYRRARLGIGYLPQEASIFRGLTVEQNIMAVLEVTQKNREKRKEKLESLLNEFNITRLRKSPSIALSGGERRRCEIARALASDPSYILLDEPFAGIDPIAIGDIRDLVRHLTDRGIGVLITDHNVRETLEMIDRAYIIHDGKVLTEGTPQEIVANDDVRRVYLGDMFG